MKKTLYLLTLVLMIFLLIGCNQNNAPDTPDAPSTPSTPNNPNTPSTPDTPSAPNNPNTPNDTVITGITFSDSTLTYDGKEHAISITGTLPEGASVTYTNNVGTNVGTYTATASISGEGYVTLTLNATLKIERATYDMSNVTWSSFDFTYDGNAHTVTVSGLPSGVTVKSYSDNEKVNAGHYEAKVYFNYDTLNYNEPQLQNFQWNIKKATYAGISFKGDSFDYDGIPKSIEVSGAIPTGTNIIYSCKEDANIKNSAIEIGKYTITATLKNPNFNDISFEATLSIKGLEDERFIVASNGVLYFANALHEDALYMWNGSVLSLVSKDTPYNFTVKGEDIYFRSKAFVSSSIKTINITSGSYSIDSVANVKGEYLTTDGVNLYYAVNGLTQSGSGIYKLTLPASSDSEPIITRLSSGKAKYLQYYNNYLYFADGENGYKLSKISTSGGTKTLLRDEKINCLTLNNGYLFYTVNNLIGDYIENYRISDGTFKKLTIDAGSNLTLIGNTLYYINVDIATSSIFGDGIYYVNAFPTNDNHLPGTKLVGNATFSSLTDIGNGKIAYYRIDNTQELIVHTLSNGTTVNVLDGFTPPEATVLSKGSKTATYNGLLYFLDLRNDKCLYSYNPVTKVSLKLTSNKVSDFSIIGDYLYYNAVNFLVNNDLYRMNLKLGGEPEKISTFDANDIVFDGTNIFYVEKNAAGVRTALRAVSSDGNDPILYSSGISNLRYYDGYLYFIDGDNLYRMPTVGYVVDEPELIRKNDVDIFEIYNGVIYFREVLIINKQLSKINVNGSGYEVVATGYDPVDILIHNGYVYFYSDTVKSSTAGIFKISLNGGIVTPVMPKNSASITYYPTEISIIDNDLYFVNYALAGVGGDSHLYKLSLSDGTIEKVK